MTEWAMRGPGREHWTAAAWKLISGMRAMNVLMWNTRTLNERTTDGNRNNRTRTKEIKIITLFIIFIEWNGRAGSGVWQNDVASF